jgi:hypothetical protein
MGNRVVCHRQQYTHISDHNRQANTILATGNRRVTNPQIELTENPMFIEINPGRRCFTMKGVLYKVISAIDENNIQSVANNPVDARSQELPPNISITVFRAAIMNDLGANAVRRALGPSRAIIQ